MNKIPLFVYVAQNNPRGAKEVLRKFGLPNPEKPSDLMRGLRYIMATKGEDGFIEIAKVHPDRHLILDTQDVLNTKNTVKEEKSNCNGDTKCTSCDMKSNCNGNSKCKCSEAKSNACGCSNFSSIDAQDKTKSLSKEDVRNEVNSALSQTNLFVKHNLPYLVLIGVGAFLYTGIFKSK